jgi:hypothetical protein
MGSQHEALYVGVRPDVTDGTAKSALNSVISLSALSLSVPCKPTNPGTLPGTHA